MDRRENATGFRSAGFVVRRVIPDSVLLALMVLLAVLLGCQKQINTLTRTSRHIRPATQTVRLVQNAKYLRKSGSLELAVEELEKARLQEPENLKILDLLARCYEDLGHFERAQEVYEEALSQAGHHPALENNRCYSLYLQGRFNQAEACFRQVLAQHPDNQTARNNLGLVLCRQGREAEALSLWREDLSIAEARQRLGQALAALGREVPPSLAATDSTPGGQQTAAADKPAAASHSEPSGFRTQIPEGQESPGHDQAQAASEPSLSMASSDQNLIIAATADESPTETAEQPAAQEPAPAAGAPADRLAAKSQEQRPEPAAALEGETQTGPQNAVAAAAAGKEQPTVAVDSAGPESAAEATPVLTALDLWEAEIELKNGNGVTNCARNFRSLLGSEGFNVVSIGNHMDFGLEETTIAYRSEAAPVAQVLAQNYFPEAKLEAKGKTSPWADIRVSLGRDLAVAQDLPGQGQEKVAAVESATTPPVAPVSTAPSEKAARAETPPATPAPGTVNHDVAAVRPPDKMRIELRNGNGVPGQAREMRRLLRVEGFKVINIGNCKDYDLKKTVIAYRPEAAGIAEALSQKFFSGANLEEKGSMPFWLDIRVLMGQDLVADQKQLAQMNP